MINSTRRLRLSIVAASLCLSASLAAADCPWQNCPGDLNDDQAVTLTDLAMLLADFGCAPPATCSGDVDGDGDTELSDLSVMLANFGSTCGPFVYPPESDQPDAEQIALEMLGPDGGLFADEEVIQRIVIDMNAIRSLQPSLVAQAHSPRWVSTHLLVGLVAGADPAEYECLKGYYEAVVFGSIPSLRLEFLRFPRAINPAAMGVVFSELAAVEYAEPDGIIGGENSWTPTPVGAGIWSWTVDDGFMDCFDGCDCHRVYEFQTDGLGGATQTNYSEWGQDWCEF